MQDKEYKKKTEELILNLNIKPEPMRTEKNLKKALGVAVIVGILFGLLPFAAGFILIFFVNDAAGIAAMIAPYAVFFICVFIRKRLLINGFFKIKNTEERIVLRRIISSEEFETLFQNPILTIKDLQNRQFTNFIYNWLNRCNALQSDKLILKIVSGKLFINSDFVKNNLSDTGEPYIYDTEQFICIDLNDLLITDENSEQFIRESKMIGTVICLNGFKLQEFFMRFYN